MLNQQGNLSVSQRRYESGKIPGFLANSPIWPSLSHNLQRALFLLLRPSQGVHMLKLRNTASSDLLAASLKPYLASNSLYVHIPKAAGTSVTQSLYGRKTGDHRRIDDYKLCFSEAELERSFKFTIVRNPWDRALSAYNYLKQGGRNADDQQWANTHLAAYQNFSDFVLNWMSPSNIRESLHFCPQYEFLCSRGGEIEVDFVGRFETLEQDYLTIASKIGCNTALATLNSSGDREDYRCSYNDKTRARIAELYERDISLLGYHFNEPPKGQKPLLTPNAATGKSRPT